MEHIIQKGLPPEGRMIREKVFVEEQGFKEEFDEIDDMAFHALIYKDGNPAGIGRTFPSKEEETTYIIGRLAVLKEYRKLRLGKEIMEILEKKAKQEGASYVKLSAQLQAKGFYEKNGYNAAGEIYYEEHCPHITMKKDL